MLGDLAEIVLGYFAVEHFVRVEGHIDPLLARAKARIATDLDALFVWIELFDEVAKLVEEIAAALFSAVAAFTDVAESVAHGVSGL